MSEFYVMHGPRGQVQTVKVGGREHIALWPDMLSALRYKARHPELLKFWTVPLDRRLYERKFLGPRSGQDSFFLMSGSNPGFEVARGRVIERGEIEAGLYPEWLRPAAAACATAYAPAAAGRQTAVLIVERQGGETCNVDRQAKRHHRARGLRPRHGAPTGARHRPLRRDGFGASHRPAV